MTPKPQLSSRLQGLKFMQRGMARAESSKEGGAPAPAAAAPTSPASTAKTEGDERAASGSDAAAQEQWVMPADKRSRTRPRAGMMLGTGTRGSSRSRRATRSGQRPPVAGSSLGVGQGIQRQTPTWAFPARNQMMMMRRRRIPRMTARTRSPRPPPRRTRLSRPRAVTASVATAGLRSRRAPRRRRSASGRHPWPARAKASGKSSRRGSGHRCGDTWVSSMTTRRAP